MVAYLMRTFRYRDCYMGQVGRGFEEEGGGDLAAWRIENHLIEGDVHVLEDADEMVGHNVKLVHLVCLILLLDPIQYPGQFHGVDLRGHFPRRDLLHLGLFGLGDLLRGFLPWGSP